MLFHFPLWILAIRCQPGDLLLEPYVSEANIYGTCIPGSRFVPTLPNLGEGEDILLVDWIREVEARKSCLFYYEVSIPKLTAVEVYAQHKYEYFTQFIHEQVSQLLLWADHLEFDDDDYNFFLSELTANSENNNEERRRRHSKRSFRILNRHFLTHPNSRDYKIKAYHYECSSTEEKNLDSKSECISNIHGYRYKYETILLNSQRSAYYYLTLGRQARREIIVTPNRFCVESKPIYYK